MLTDSTALVTLLEHATAARDEATAQLYLMLEQVRRFSTQRDQLLSYRREYEARWSAQFRDKAAIEVVHSYRSFIERLNQALEQLDRQTREAEAQAQQARERLVERETRVASVRKLLERRTDERQRHLALREQKATDEMAALKHWHARPSMVAANH